MFVNKLKERLKEIKQNASEFAEFAKAETSEERMKICKSCDFFIPITSTCKKCGCFMSAKTKLKNASCPINKW